MMKRPWREMGDVREEDGVEAHYLTLIRGHQARKMADGEDSD